MYDLEQVGDGPHSVGVIGLGYVGLPLAIELAEAGLRVVGVDLDQRKLTALRAGESYIEDVDSARLAAIADRFRVSRRYADLATVDATVIAVPTPLDRNREPDLGPLVGAAQELSRVLQRGQLVVLESTTYPGTTRERLVPLLEESGLAAGVDFSVAYSPERIDPGRTDFTLRNTPKVIGGLTPDCARRAVRLYSRVCESVVEVSTPEVAELTKLLENVFRSVNIALVNELSMLCDRMDIDIWEVVDAASSKPYGFMRFDPGPGMGGHCLPVDPFYLSWRAREFDTQTAFIELAGEVNTRMPYFCTDKIAERLNDHGLAVRGARIAILGVSYKPGVGDLRESPAMKVIELLKRRGAEILYHDEHVPELPELNLVSQPLDSVLEAADLVAVLTAHPGLDAERVVREAKAIVDFRGVTRAVSGVPARS